MDKQGFTAFQCPRKYGGWPGEVTRSSSPAEERVRPPLCQQQARVPAPGKEGRGVRSLELSVAGRDPTLNMWQEELERWRRTLRKTN